MDEKLREKLNGIYIELDQMYMPSILLDDSKSDKLGILTVLYALANALGYYRDAEYIESKIKEL